MNAKFITTEIISFPLNGKMNAQSEDQVHKLKRKLKSIVPITSTDPYKKQPTPVQYAWLRRGLKQPGGKLPLFGHKGRRINARTIQICIAQGWAEPWFANPVLKTKWQVCRLTKAGRRLFDQ